MANAKRRKGDKIGQFKDEKRFLSNFYGMLPREYKQSINYEGMIFPTVEHAYVAAKLESVALREEVQCLSTPGKAKRFLKERGLNEPEDWSQRKEKVMLELVRQKYKVPELAELLLQTGDAELEEGNTWSDQFWGVDLATGKGENKLGKILMKVRAEIREGRFFDDLQIAAEIIEHDGVEGYHRAESVIGGNAALALVVAYVRKQALNKNIPHESIKNEVENTLRRANIIE